MHMHGTILHRVYTVYIYTVLTCNANDVGDGHVGPFSTKESH